MDAQTNDKGSEVKTSKPSQNKEQSSEAKTSEPIQNKEQTSEAKTSESSHNKKQGPEAKISEPSQINKKDSEVVVKEKISADGPVSDCEQTTEGEAAAEQKAPVKAPPIRKFRKTLTRRTIENFLLLLDTGIQFKEMERPLGLSRSSVTRLYQRYLTGEFEKLDEFKTAPEKRSCKGKDFGPEMEVIAAEVAANPRITLGELAEKLSGATTTRDSSYSKAKVSRIMKKMDYPKRRRIMLPVKLNNERLKRQAEENKKNKTS